PQMRQDIKNKWSEISVPPRSLSPRSLCLSSRATIFSFELVWPRRASRRSDSQRIESKPSAAQMLLLQKSGMTSVKIATISLVFIKHSIVSQTRSEQIGNLRDGRGSRERKRAGKIMSHSDKPRRG